MVNIFVIRLTKSTYNVSSCLVSWQLPIINCQLFVLSCNTLVCLFQLLRQGSRDVSLPPRLTTTQTSCSHPLTVFCLLSVTFTALTLFRVFNNGVLPNPAMSYNQPSLNPFLLLRLFLYLLYSLCFRVRGAKHCT